MEKNEKIKFFIFSDESGSWHDADDVYVRSWVVITENDSEKLLNKIEEIKHFLNANELSWKTLAGNESYFSYFDDLNFRIFITISSPRDILWDRKYVVTKNFNTNIENFDFGELDINIEEYIKDRILRDIKNALFLNFYEKFHIENAKKGIERVIKPTDYELIYRIDPPQMPKDGWKKILTNITGTSVNIEFPKSSKSQGIQFADIIAGCVRSLLIKDNNYNKACVFLKRIKKKLIAKNKNNPNPNLIFYGEINKELISRCGAIWNI